MVLHPGKESPKLVPRANSFPGRLNKKKKIKWKKKIE
jgi:hypothetical protein